jgi:hypothetical protein
MKFQIGHEITWIEKGYSRTGRVFAYGAPGIILVESWDKGCAEIVNVQATNLRDAAANSQMKQQLAMEMPVS